ncbi:MAG: 30S ribosomal protein S17 [Candidatus Electryonea clarkiae]|nr:30S ribosomal protein S17 [Candidatus Electryonea clarkiae]MDP8288618.1 30S ribosomal protein S17 [Candidatus Electryonea clarkiae]
MKTRGSRKVVTGTIVSDKADKTVTVLVSRRIRHPLYKKFITKSKKYHAHDENNDCGMGDIVKVMESRPFSKTKRWRVTEIVRKAV